MSQRNKRLAEGTNALLHNLRNDVYSKASYNSLEMIGSANKQWVPLVSEGATLFDNYEVGIDGYQNQTSNNVVMVFGLTEPLTKGTLALVWNDTNVGIKTADVNDFLTRIRIGGWVDNTSANTQVDDGSNYSAPTDLIYGHGVVSSTNYKRMHCVINTANASANKLQIGYVRAQIYYI